jgi:hypothetical protein
MLVFSFCVFALCLKFLSRSIDRRKIIELVKSAAFGGISTKKTTLAPLDGPGSGLSLMLAHRVHLIEEIDGRARVKHLNGTGLSG